MKICAVICEFNPFHNGHEYLLKSAKQLTGCDAILCVMSGNFVQRAEPAIITKQHRAFVALKCGADIVAELPIIYATANASTFAYGAINIITKFKNITHLAFGCEDNTIEHLKALAQISANEDKEFKATLHLFLNQGFSYPKSLALTLSKIAENQGFSSVMSDIILSKPNNLLAIEYMKHLNLANSAIVPLPIKREGDGYNDLKLSMNFSSASAIRKFILENQQAEFSEKQNEFNAIKSNIPPAMLDAILANHLHFPDYKIFSALTVEAIRANALSELIDSGEGLEIKLKKEAEKYTDLNRIIDATKSKRYTHAKIRRLCLQALLNINYKSTASPTPIRILGIKKTMKSYLKFLPQYSIIQNKDYDTLTPDYNNYLLIEKKASSVYSLIARIDGDPFYSYKLVEV